MSQSSEKVKAERKCHEMRPQTADNVSVMGLCDMVYLCNVL